MFAPCGIKAGSCVGGVRNEDDAAAGSAENELLYVLRVGVVRLMREIGGYSDALAAIVQIDRRRSHFFGDRFHRRIALAVRSVDANAELILRAEAAADIEMSGGEGQFRCELKAQMRASSTMTPTDYRNLEQQLSTRLDFIYATSEAMNTLEYQRVLDWATLDCKKYQPPERTPEEKATREQEAREKMLRELERRRERQQREAQ